MGKCAFLVAALAVLVLAQAGVGRANRECPGFENGTWAVGELRNFESATGEPSRMMNHFYESKTPRACCDACARVEGCSYWTWFQKDKGSPVGDCALFKSFACESDPLGTLPLIPNKKARTGSNVCSRPESRAPAPLADKKDAAISEMKAALNAELAVREEASQKWKSELDAAEVELAEAEKAATQLEDDVEAAKAVADAATLEVAKATAAEKAANEKLRTVEDALLKAKALVSQEAAFAEKAREEYVRSEQEIKSARRSKEASDAMLVVEIAEEVQAAQKEVDDAPYSACPPRIASGKWAVGLLRDLEGSKMDKSFSYVSPSECCSACSETSGCKYWSLSLPEKRDFKGLCSLFTEAGCNADSKGNLPFQRNTKLGRVGQACSEAAQ